jgi:hypothetical protein
MSPTIVVAGSVAQRPHRGGHTWVFLQYLLGFRRLGWDVLLLDRLEPGMYVDRRGRPTEPERSVNVDYLTSVMGRAGLADSWALLTDGGREVLGLSRAALRERLARSALLLNVMGFLDDEELLAAAPRRVFLDIDPGFGQMWRAAGWHDLFAGHDDHVTIGENIGMPDCTIPTCGIDWITTKQPVVRSEWPTSPRPEGSFTTVASWRGPYAPVDFEGHTYGLRVHEFRKFMELPSRTGLAFEVALDIDDAEVPDLDRLRQNRWQLADPFEVAADPWRYRDHIRGSLAELMVAKGMYVATRSGWFSDRSACYLMSGRPVLAQDTGLRSVLPVGEGLLAFSTLEEAVDGARAIAAQPERHSRTARAIAEDYFESDRVLGRLLDQLGVAATPQPRARA